MNRFNIATLILIAVGLAGFMIPAASADIYSWTDENGVQHFTNQEPPEDAELLIKSPEISHDEEAHQRRLEEDRLALARQELAEREAYLLQQQQEAERRLAAANARAEATLQQADQLLRDAEASAATYDNQSYSSVGFYNPYYRIGPKVRHYGIYRPGLNLHRKHLHRKHPYKFNKHYRFKYKNFNKHHSKAIAHKRLSRSPKFRSHYSLTLGRYKSHQGRTAAFRGRHGHF